MRYLLTVVAMAVGSGQAVAGVNLLPHRAFYEMTASNIEKKAGFISAKGLLAYEITGSRCDGWTTSYRIVTRYLRNEQGDQLTDTQVSSWEAGDGSKFQMEEKQFSDRKLVSQTNVSATKQQGAEGVGHETRPVDQEFKIPKEAVFPMMHQTRLISDAMAGHERNASLIFEGSDDNKPMSALAVIGKARDATRMQLSIDDKAAAQLKMGAAYPMSVSYYPAEPNAADAPEYQTSFTMFDNGVSTDLHFDYGGYVLQGKLIKLEFLPVSTCP